MAFGRIKFERHRLRETRDGVLWALAQGKQDSEVLQRRHQCRIDGDRLLETQQRRLGADREPVPPRNRRSPPRGGSGEGARRRRRPGPELTAERRGPRQQTPWPPRCCRRVVRVARPSQIARQNAWVRSSECADKVARLGAICRPAEGSLRW